MSKLSYGNCFVTAVIVVSLPFCSRQRELIQVRWWPAAELPRCGLDGFEPHLLRALDALRFAGTS